jgi:hypothetical protein
VKPRPAAAHRPRKTGRTLPVPPGSGPPPPNPEAPPMIARPTRGVPDSAPLRLTYRYGTLRPTAQKEDPRSTKPRVLEGPDRTGSGPGPPTLINPVREGRSSAMNSTAARADCRGRSRPSCAPRPSGPVVLAAHPEIIRDFAVEVESFCRTRCRARIARRRRNRHPEHWRRSLSHSTFATPGGERLPW